MEPKSPRYSKAAQIGIIIGAILIVLGILRLSERFFGTTWWGMLQSTFGTLFSFLWPAALIGLGIYVIWAAKTGKFKGASFDGSRPLRRSPTDKRISGVCGGIAQYLTIDSTMVRVLAVILLIVSPWATLLVYLVATVLVPKA